MKRILTATVALPILLYTVWNDIPYFFALLTAIAVLLGLQEFYNLASKLELRPQTILGYLAGTGVVACFTFRRVDLIIAVMAALAIVTLAIEVFRAEDVNKVLPSVAATVFGVVYVALLAGFLVGVRMIPDTATTPVVSQLAAKLMTTFFAMVMMTDTGAYYTGRTLGRHKLAPKVSPGKTIEGSIGGFITAAVAGIICKYAFFPEAPIAHIAILGAIIGIVSQIGDLAESLLKRGSGVKDSGAIFPGHGGMLDRVDSLLFCAPILYYYAEWIL